MSRGLLSLLAALLLLAAPAGAQEPRTSFTDVEDEVMCISCNVPLNVAESPQADATRRLIRDLVDDGLGKEEIKDRLVAQYGPNILAEPENEGFGLAAYLVPIAAGALLIGLLVLLLPRWRRRTTAAAGAGAGSEKHLSSVEASALEADMARYER